MAPALCVVCQLRPRRGVLFCRLCARSYDKTVEGTVASAIDWTAKRARYFANRRNAKARGSKDEHEGYDFMRVCVDCEHWAHARPCNAKDCDCTSRRGVRADVWQARRDAAAKVQEELDAGRDDKPAPTYNHTRGDSPRSPCPKCR